MSTHQEKSQYFYSKQDYAEHKRMYMYSAFEWESFLETYFSNRKEILEKIHRKELCEIIPKTKFISSDEYFHKFCKSFLSEVFLENDFCSSIDLVLKKFEIKGKIFNAKNSTQEISAKDYIKISYTLSLSNFITPISHKHLNFFLKLNDKIIYMQEKWLGTEEETYFFHALSHEVALVQFLQKEESA